MKTTSFRLILMLVLLVTIVAVPAMASVNALYEQVQVKYRTYLDLVQSGADHTQIKTAMEAYREVYDRYLDTITSGKSEDEMYNEEGQILSSDGSRNTTGIIKPTKSKLYSKKQSLQDMINRLEKALVPGLSARIEAHLKLQLAFLYQEFKQDNSKAEELVNQVLELATKDDIGQELLNEATQLHSRLKTKNYCASMMDGVLDKKQAAYAARDAYNNTSFWKSPFKKVKNLFSYWGKRASYRLDVAKYRVTKESYELSGKLTLRAEGMTALFDISKYEFGVKDVFDAMDITDKGDLTDIHLLRNNNDAWYARWYLLNNAKRTIDVTYFIFDHDVFGASMFGLLMKKANEGVKVRLMVDTHGTKDFTGFFSRDYLEEMAAHKNMEVRVYNPVLDAIPRAWQDLRTIVGSNHDKIVLVDDEWMITGGRNITRYYFSMHEDLPDALVDTDVIFRSPRLANLMQSAFTEEFEDLYCKKITPDLLGNWIKRDHELSMAYKAMNRYIRGDGFFMDSKDKHLVEYSNQLYVLPSMQHFTKYRPFPDNLKAPVRVLDKHSFNSEKNEISENILRLMDAATSEILMQNPYIEFTPTALQAMRRADARGVKIIIHTTSPASSDSLMSQVFFAEEWKNHLASMPNMRIYAFTGKKVLHSKIFIFDNQISIVGTYNMDYMSEQINSEVVAVVNSEKFSADLHKSVDEDIAESMEYKIRINNGQIEVIQGPRTVTDSTTMLKLDLLRKIKILRPLI